MRLCRSFNQSITAVLLESPEGEGLAGVSEWATQQGEATADDPEGTFTDLMAAMETIVGLQEQEGHGETVDWRTALDVVPALMKGALGASTNFHEGEWRFIPPFKERLAELAKHNEYTTARA